MRRSKSSEYTFKDVNIHNHASFLMYLRTQVRIIIKRKPLFSPHHWTNNINSLFLYVCLSKRIFIRFVLMRQLFSKVFVVFHMMRISTHFGVFLFLSHFDLFETRVQHLISFGLFYLFCVVCKVNSNKLYGKFLDTISIDGNSFGTDKRN